MTISGNYVTRVGEFLSSAGWDVRPSSSIHSEHRASHDFVYRGSIFLGFTFYSGYGEEVVLGYDYNIFGSLKQISEVLTFRDYCVSKNFRVSEDFESREKLKSALIEGTKDENPLKSELAWSVLFRL